MTAVILCGTSYASFRPSYQDDINNLNQGNLLDNIQIEGDEPRVAPGQPGADVQRGPQGRRDNNRENPRANNRRPQNNNLKSRIEAQVVRLFSPEGGRQLEAGRDFEVEINGNNVEVTFTKGAHISVPVGYEKNGQFVVVSRTEMDVEGSLSFTNANANQTARSGMLKHMYVNASEPISAQYSNALTNISPLNTNISNQVNTAGGERVQISAFVGRGANGATQTGLAVTGRAGRFNNGPGQILPGNDALPNGNQMIAAGFGRLNNVQVNPVAFGNLASTLRQVGSGADATRVFLNKGLQSNADPTQFKTTVTPLRNAAVKVELSGNLSSLVSQSQSSYNNPVIQALYDNNAADIDEGVATFVITPTQFKVQNIETQNLGLFQSINNLIAGP